MNDGLARWKGALCYTGILSFLFIRTKNDFVRFHAKQGIFLFFAALLSLLIPILGWILIFPFVLITAFTAAFKALDSKMWKIPVLKRFIKY